MFFIWYLSNIFVFFIGGLIRVFFYLSGVTIGISQSIVTPSLWQLTWSVKLCFCSQLYFMELVKFICTFHLCIPIIARWWTFKYSNKQNPEETLGIKTKKRLQNHPVVLLHNLNCVYLNTFFNYYFLFVKQYNTNLNWTLVLLSPMSPLELIKFYILYNPPVIIVGVIFFNMWHKYYAFSESHVLPNSCLRGKYLIWMQNLGKSWQSARFCVPRPRGTFPTEKRLPVRDDT